MSAKNNSGKAGQEKNTPFWKQKSFPKGVNIGMGVGGAVLGGAISAQEKMPPVLSLALGAGLLVLSEYVETPFAPLAVAGGAAMLGGVRYSDMAEAQAKKAPPKLENGKRTAKTEIGEVLEDARAYGRAMSKKLMLDKILGSSKKESSPSGEIPMQQPPAMEPPPLEGLGEAAAFQLLDEFQAGIYRDMLETGHDSPQGEHETRQVEYRPVDGVDFDRM